LHIKGEEFQDLKILSKIKDAAVKFINNPKDCLFLKI